METIWNALRDRAVASGAGDVLAGALASALCALAVIGVNLALCAMISYIARRFMSKPAAHSPQSAKLASTVRTLIWAVFTWILHAWLPIAIHASSAATQTLSRILHIATVLIFAATLSNAITYLRMAASSLSKGQAFASKTLSQMTKILVWFTASIIAISALMGKSPAFVLSGLGALTAVLMLIFRDSILGLVAGIQVSQNDMVRVGDWITMPKYNADGTVIDIALTTVKVRNFDNTVTMIPSSALISDSFVNWRYMSTSKGRRIKRPVWISVISIKEVPEEMRQSLVDQGLLLPTDRPVSNLEAFETWLGRMLKTHPDISQELTCMVRQTEAGDTGIPVEVYAFTKTRDWEAYESIQTAVFDRIFVTAPKFNLQIYQRSSDKAPLVR